MALIYPFSQRTAGQLESFPPQGCTHRWLAQVAAGLRDTFPPERCATVLARLCGEVRHRRITDREVQDAVAFAYGQPRPPTGARKIMPALTKPRTSFDWPSADPALMEQVIRDMEPLFDASGDTGLTAAGAIRQLYDPDDLLCTGPSQLSALVRSVEDTARDAEFMQFIVPNPMKGLEAMNKKGELSKRCQANVKERRYLVAEFDLPDQGHDAQARLITALAKKLPCCMVVDSGGKSLHAWFAVRGMIEPEAAQFFGFACGLGADATRWDPCGWLRMPGGLRVRPDGTRVRQRIVYFEREHIL